jgi:hypothetical protein
MKIRPSGEQQTTDGALMAGACATISARQPGWQLSASGLVSLAGAFNVSNTNSARHVKCFFKRK